MILRKCPVHIVLATWRPADCNKVQAITHSRAHQKKAVGQNDLQFNMDMRGTLTCYVGSVFQYEKQALSPE